jgi:hypothetical protein
MYNNIKMRQVRNKFKNLFCRKYKQLFIRIVHFEGSGRICLFMHIIKRHTIGNVISSHETYEDCAVSYRITMLHLHRNMRIVPCIEKP